MRGEVSPETLDKTIAQRFQGRDDFEASIRILSAAEGGRQTSPRDGIRWDICYIADDPKDGIWMVWPDFLDESGESRSELEVLPASVWLTAKMFVVIDEMRAQVHRNKAVVGERFLCHEGSKRIAEGIVTKITHLFDERIGNAGHR